MTVNPERHPYVPVSQPVRYVGDRDALAQHRGRERVAQRVRREPRRYPRVPRGVHEPLIDGSVELERPFPVAGGEGPVRQAPDHVP